ncbi:hypothetical protein EMPS_04732 [Entomortierella parvispora]|uniref:Uncharacterized protein n=1 Tax=Entomortierella parvispora TaxID=205924 RepID=A0A9P3H925_9FUNG|nr:hypothetical protein EMPS_04732 [Entomortierella parvispora]
MEHFNVATSSATSARLQPLPQQQQQQSHHYHPYRHPASLHPPSSLAQAHAQGQAQVLTQAHTQAQGHHQHINPLLQHRQPQQTQLVHPHASLQAPPFPAPTAAFSGFRAALEQRRPSLSSLPPSTGQTISAPNHQSIVATGAMPVRQALHSYISTLYDKPPRSREEAQQALEEMFRLRAEKVRQSIEQGTLATTEALQHKVIRRRKSVVLQEGKQGQSEKKTAPAQESGSSRTEGQQAESSSSTAADTVADNLLPSLSWGLSDDDLMASLSSFTAKLGDSLLAEQRQLQDFDVQDHNSNHTHNHSQNQSVNRNYPNLPSEQIGGVSVTMMGLSTPALAPPMPIFSPPSLAQSPTTSTESLSPSPWMPWLHDNDPLLQRIANSETIQPALLPTSTSTYSQGLLIQNDGLSMPTKQFGAPDGNPYMQYLQTVQPLQQGAQPATLTGYAQPTMAASNHQTTFVDPQWQATMMAMMMGQGPVLEPRHGGHAHAQRH